MPVVWVIVIIISATVILATMLYTSQPGSNQCSVSSSATPTGIKTGPTTLNEKRITHSDFVRMPKQEHDLIFALLERQDLHGLAILLDIKDFKEITAFKEPGTSELVIKWTPA